MHVEDEYGHRLPDERDLEGHLCACGVVVCEPAIRCTRCQAEYDEHWREYKRERPVDLETLVADGCACPCGELIGQGHRLCGECAMAEADSLRDEDV